MAVLAAVLVPLKSFSQAKLRLSAVLDPDQRAELAKTMAQRVLASAGDLPTAVVCDDPQVARWAQEHSSMVIWQPGKGLNAAVQAGVEHLGRLGARRVVVAAGDLPLADDLGWTLEFPGVTLIPDRVADGTNVICLPTDCGFVFSYGRGSFLRHLAQTKHLGLPARVVRCSPMAFDVDEPQDLPVLATTCAAPPFAG